MGDSILTLPQLLNILNQTNVKATNKLGGTKAQMTMQEVIQTNSTINSTISSTPSSVNTGTPLDLPLHRHLDGRDKVTSQGTSSVDVPCSAD